MLIGPNVRCFKPHLRKGLGAEGKSLGGLTPTILVLVSGYRETGLPSSSSVPKERCCYAMHADTSFGLGGGMILMDEPMVLIAQAFELPLKILFFSLQTAVVKIPIFV